MKKNEMNAEPALSEPHGGRSEEMRRAHSTEDRRVLRTRRALKDTLLTLMKEKSFDKITVKEICDRALTSRITFYNYYSDKYALLEEITEDMNDMLKADFEEREKKNTEHSASVSYMNMLDCFLDLHIRYEDILRNIDLQRNTLLLPGYYQFLAGNTAKIIEKSAGHFRPNYPTEKISALLVMGMYAYIHLSSTEHEDSETTRRSAHSVLNDLIRSGLFTEQ